MGEQEQYNLVEPGEWALLGELADALGLVVAGGASETAVWREATPLPCKVLFVSHHIRNVHSPAKPAGHTLTKGPAMLKQEGSRLFFSKCRF